MTPDNRKQRRHALAVGRQKAGEGSKRRPAADGSARTHALVAGGRISDAFELFAALAIGSPNDPVVRGEFGWFMVFNTPVKPHPGIDPWLIRALDQCWIRPDYLAVPVARYLSAKAPLAARATTPSPPSDFLRLDDVAALARDPLLHALLRATPAATPTLDVFLARLRRACLAAWCDGRDIDWLRPVLINLAMRGQSSGFALTLPADNEASEKQGAEDEDLGRLRQQIETADGNGRMTSAAVALLGCYRPLACSGRATALVASDPALAVLHASHVIAPAREAEIARSLVPQTSFDPTTAPVIDQYEEHPYPLWVQEPVTPADIPRAVAKALGPAGRNGVRSVLVAGCGTGQHAIAAVCRWPRAQILAIDSSRASLAHAIRKAQELALPRIDFALADLLAVGELGKRFSVIEAVGVLHHLDDPGAGLAALAAVLSPGGVMLIGLYARAARRRLDLARALAGEAWPATAGAIREFRSRALSELDAPEITFSPDFFSVGGSRDLLFHTRETDFTLPETRSLVAQHGLSVLAIDAPTFAEQLLNVPPAPEDIDGWSAAEEAHPTLFGAMYQLWIARDGRR